MENNENEIKKEENKLEVNEIQKTREPLICEEIQLGNRSKRNRKKNKKKRFKILPLIVIIIVIGIIGILSLLAIYNFNISAMGQDSSLNIVIEKGDTYSTIGAKLEENGLISSEFFYKIYLKLNEVDDLKEGVHNLNGYMDVEEIVKTLSSDTYKEEITLTFKEGVNMRGFIEVLETSTTIKKQEVLDKLKDQTYLQTLIDKYWFVTEDILDKDIYYSLEGYLYPDTYNFLVDANIEDFFEKMLDNMELKLKEFKSDVEDNKYSIHELLTVGSIIELEAKHKEDRAGVASVFYNRLESNMSLGSDVTTYYAEDIDMGDRDLYQSELDEYNAYNTRASQMSGKLPIGPICNMDISSIKAAIYPEETENYYFVADKYGEVYFTKTYSQHNNRINQLVNEGKWFTY